MFIIIKLDNCRKARIIDIANVYQVYPVCGGLEIAVPQVLFRNG